MTGISRCMDEASLFERVRKAASALEFERVAYGLRMPLPLAGPKVVVISNYPRRWRRRYVEAGYLATDPTVLHARRSQAPIIWDDALIASAPAFWAEAHAFGLREGWAQSSIDGRGVAGMLTLSRSSLKLTRAELRAKDAHMRWLVSATHVAFSRLLAPKLDPALEPSLTDREVEVLKWIADGKTSRDIAQILGISPETVNFHVKNSIAKLGAPNKTAAAVRAALLGLFD